MSITEVFFPNEEVVDEEKTDQVDDNEQEQQEGDDMFVDDEVSDDHQEEIDQITHIKIASPDSITILSKNG